MTTFESASRALRAREAARVLEPIIRVTLDSIWKASINDAPLLVCGNRIDSLDRVDKEAMQEEIKVGWVERRRHFVSVEALEISAGPRP